MTLNSVYAHTGNVVRHGRRAYAYSPVEPSFLLEGPYDEEGPDGNGWNDAATQPLRRFQWWGWLSTIGGYVLGNGYVWPFNPNWQAHLDTQCTNDMTRLNAFMVTRKWYDLVPSGLRGMRNLITEGGSSEGLNNYVSAAATPDGALLIAYIPPAHQGTITVDMTALNGPSRALWFDPTDAAYWLVGTELSNVGTHVFSPNGKNSAGDRDWVLLLETDSVVPTPSTPATFSRATVGGRRGFSLGSDEYHEPIYEDGAGPFAAIVDNSHNSASPGEIEAIHQKSKLGDICYAEGRQTRFDEQNE
jgi:hypothetical protein